MRVGIDVTYAAKREGTGTYIRNLINALARHPEIEIITFARPQLAFLRRLPRPLARLTNGLLSVIWLQVFVPLMARQQRLDLFHAPAFLAPLFLPCPLVVTLLDAFQNSLRAQPDRLWSLYLHAFSRLVVGRAAKVLTISHYAADDLRHFFDLKGDRLVVTPLGVAPEFKRLPTGQTGQLLADYALPDRYLLFVGAGDPRKNYATLIAALRRLREQQHPVPPVLVTGNPTAEFRALAAELNDAGTAHIRFLGFVSEEVLIALYNRASAFIFPSRYEGFGLPVLEAMACGCPVICSNTTSLPEVACEAAMLIDPENSAALAAAITTIIGDQDLRARLIEAGVQRASTFTWAHTAEQTLSAYHEVA